MYEVQIEKKLSLLVLQIQLLCATSNVWKALEKPTELVNWFGALTSSFLVLVVPP